MYLPWVILLHPINNPMRMSTILIIAKMIMVTPWEKLSRQLTGLIINSNATIISNTQGKKIRSMARRINKPTTRRLTIKSISIKLNM